MALQVGYSRLVDCLNLSGKPFHNIAPLHRKCNFPKLVRGQVNLVQSEIKSCLCHTVFCRKTEDEKTKNREGGKEEEEKEGEESEASIIGGSGGRSGGGRDRTVLS